MKLYLLLSILVFVVNADTNNNQKTVEFSQEQRDLMYKINYWFAGFRGFLQGTKRGFYKEYSFEI